MGPHEHSSFSVYYNWVNRHAESTAHHSAAQHNTAQCPFVTVLLTARDPDGHQDHNQKQGHEPH